jgi:hypothetical protein
VNRTVLSAQRVGHDPRRHAALGSLLAALGFRAEEVTGRWRGRSEVSWEVADLPSPLAVLLARLFDQEAVLANGFLYRLDPSGDARWAQPVVRIDEHVGRCADACTRRTDGRAWHAVLGPARPVAGPLGSLGRLGGDGPPPVAHASPRADQ